MNGIYVEIPDNAPAAVGGPRLQLRAELLRRLVAAMYADEIVGGSATCILQGLVKSEIHQWGCDAVPVIPLGALDYALERRNLDEWLADV